MSSLLKTPPSARTFVWKHRTCCFIADIWKIVVAKSKFHPITLPMKTRSVYCVGVMYLIHHLLWEVPFIEVQQAGLEDSSQIGHPQKWTRTQSLVIWEKHVPETMCELLTFYLRYSLSCGITKRSHRLVYHLQGTSSCYIGIKWLHVTHRDWKTHWNLLGRQQRLEWSHPPMIDCDRFYGKMCLT